MDPENGASLFDMNLDALTQQRIRTVSTWTKFISVTCFILGGILLILAGIYGPEILQAITTLLSISSNREFAGALIAVLLIIMIIIAIWIYFLYRASTLLSRGLTSRNTNLISEGFKAMKIYFIFSFIISILSLISTLAQLF